MLQHMEMEYIDQVIKSEIMNYDIKTYIDSGKLPDNYFNDSMNTRYHYIDYEKEPENKNNISMIQSITEPYYYSDHVKDIIHMEHCIHKCDTVTENIQNIIQYEQEKENENECPICFDELGENNYVKTKCNHKTCVSCFVANIKLNNRTANLCPLCREQMY